MKISEINLQETPDAVRLSAKLDDFELWYKLPAGWPASARGDAFLPPALVVSMVRDKPPEIASDAPISPQLRLGCEQIQHVLHGWDPSFRYATIQTGEKLSEPGHPGVASFFSGGLDSSYTFLRHAEEITHLILVRGSDISLADDRVFTAAVRHGEKVARAFGKTLVVAETNSLELGVRRGVRRWTYFGATLAGVALALGFRKVYVAGGQNYGSLWAAGSHLLLDRHWSTETTTFIHDGVEARRSDKLRAIAGSRVLLDGLRVCLRRGNYNCGRCEKCLRTMIPIRLLGCSSATLPLLASAAPLRAIRLRDDAEFSYCRENYELALDVGDAEIAGALLSLMRGYIVRKTVLDFDEFFCGGRLARAYRILRGRDPAGHEPNRQLGGSRRPAQPRPGRNP